MSLYLTASVLFFIITSFKINASHNDKCEQVMNVYISFYKDGVLL